MIIRNFKNTVLLFSLLLVFSACDQEEECNITGSLNVNASTDPNTASITNLSAGICPGDRVALTWSTSNAQTVAIEADNVPDIGTVNQQGSIEVSPGVSTKFKLVTSSTDCQAMENTPEVTVTVYTSPMSRSLRAGPNQSVVPDWASGIQPVQVSQRLLVTSIDSITLTDIDGNAIADCVWNAWRVDKDGSAQATTPFPAFTNPTFNPAGSYTLTAVGAGASNEFMGKCIRLYANLSMTLACPSGN